MSDAAITHPGLGRLIPVEGTAGQELSDDRARNVQVATYRATYSNVTGLRPLDRQFKVSGDTLTFLEVIGADSVYVRFGREGPFLPVEEGMTYHRRFDEIWFRAVAPGFPGGTQAGTFAEVRFAATWGTLLTRPFKQYGFRRGFLTVTLTATAAGIDIPAAIVALGGFLQRPILGKFGGTLIFKNLDNAAVLYIAQWPLAAIAPNLTGFMEIEPRQTFTMEVEGEMTNALKNPVDDVSAPIFNETLVAASAAGNVNFKLTIPRVVYDQSDYESNAPHISIE